MVSRHIKKSDDRNLRIDKQLDEAKGAAQKVAEQLIKSDSVTDLYKAQFIEVNKNLDNLWKAVNQSLEELKKHKEDDASIHINFTDALGTIKGMLMNNNNNNSK